jgi:ATP-dependent helicase/nuclease subunit A
MSSFLTGLTEQQSLAVTTRAVSVVLSSGAGCGKTHVLTARYLSHLKIDASTVPQVVAITFTERAAREMRGRIRQAIDRELLASGDESQSDWQQHLRALETAPINTIHGFCGELLRQNALLLGLDPNFEILDASFTRTLRTESSRNALQKLLVGEGEETAALHELIVLFGWNAVQAGIDSLLREADPTGWQSWLSRTPDEIAVDWVQRRDSLLPSWVAHLLAASPKLVGCLNFLEHTRGITPESRITIQRLLIETPQLADGVDLAAKLSELNEVAKVKSLGSRKAWEDAEELYEQLKEAFTDYREVVKNSFSLFTVDASHLSESARLGQQMIRVVLKLHEDFAARKRERSFVDFQDLLLRARDLLRDSPTVRESLQSRFRFLLLDELQDTDPIQMEIVSLLCGEVGLTHGKLFAVGDYKQSIYRFRGAEVQLFETLRRNTPEEGRLGLTRNFRSQPGVIDFVNALCSRRLPNYEPLVAHHPRIHESPCVEFLWQTDCKSDSVEELRRLEATNLARRIRQMIDSRERLVFDPKTGSLREVEPGDVVLLFRAMTEVAIYETALREADLDYYLVGGRAFFAQQEVFDLLNLLRSLENPEDSLSLAGVLRSPFFSLSDEALFLLGSSRGGLWAALQDSRMVADLPEDQRPLATRARSLLLDWMQEKDRQSSSRLISRILDDSGYDAALQFEFLGERKLANLWKLQEIAREFDTTERFILSDFIERLGEMVREQPREEQAATQPENANVVKLMSIHQSKGLEFPIVFLPDFARREMGDRHGNMRWHRDLGCLLHPPEEAGANLFNDLGWQLGSTLDTISTWEEDLRILYVACTRARDFLVFSAACTDSVPSTSANAWMLALSERFDLNRGDCLDSTIPVGELPRVRVVLPLPEIEVAKPTRKPEPLGELPPWRPLNQGNDFPPIVSLLRLEPRIEGAFGEPELLDIADRFLTARERAHLAAGVSMTRRESLFRRVLQQWDFRDPEEWKDILTRLLDERFSPFESGQEMNVLGDCFTHFAESSLLGELLHSINLHRDVPFRLDGPKCVAAETVLMPFEKRTIPHLEGIIDFVWQTRSGDWHLLALDRGGDEFPDEPWLGRRPILTVQAYALREQLGPRLKSLCHFDLDRDRLEEAEIKSLKFAPAFRWVYADMMRREGKEGI